MQQSLQENFKTQLNDANKKIEVKRFEIKALLNYKCVSFFLLKNQISRLCQNENRSVQCRSIENELDLYMINSTKIDRDLEYDYRLFFLDFIEYFLFEIPRDLEASVEELQNDVKSKQCYVTMNDVESFALVLSTISRSLVDLKGKKQDLMINQY